MTEKQIILQDRLVNLYAVETEPKAAKTVIFLHGWRSNGMIWTPVARLMKDLGMNLYFFDLPGFGKSEFPQHPFHLADYAGIIGDFVKKFDLPDVFIVGHSFGGRVAIKCAVEYPNMFKKIVLVDCGGFRRVEWKRGIVTFLAKILRPAFALPLLKKLRPRIYNMMGAADYLAIPELKATFLNIINEDLLEVVPKIQNSTLIIWGERDTEVPLEFGKQINSLIKNSKFVSIKMARHFSFLDKPEEFVKELVHFFSD